MQYYYFILFLIACIRADPTPNGGKPCTYNYECNEGGTCTLMPVNGTLQNVCQCDPQHGNVDCSYLRVSKNLAGGLQIGLMWVGIFGVGNFLLGNIPWAVGQLIMGLAGYNGICVISAIMCCGACGGKGAFTGAAVISGAIICLINLVVLAGFGWNLADGIKILLPPGQITDANGYYPG